MASAGAGAGELGGARSFGLAGVASRPHNAMVASHLYLILSRFFAEYGYWVLFFGVMLENSGLPIPGETVLLFAGFLAYHGQLHLGRAIVTAILGATIGDSCGYAFGYWGGKELLTKFRGRLITRRGYDRAQSAFLRWGHWAVFVGRFITGLRVLAGPFAGAFRMPYPRFLAFNFSGAVIWATAIGCIGFVFGSSFGRLVHLFKQIDLAILIAAVAVAAVVFFLYRRRHQRR